MLIVTDARKRTSAGRSGLCPVTDTARLLDHRDRCAAIYEAPDSLRQSDSLAHVGKFGKCRVSGGRPADCAVRKNNTLPIARRMVKR